MPVNFTEIDRIMQEGVPQTAPAAQIAIRLEGNQVFSKAYGFIDPDTRELRTRLNTLFDMASITKLFTTTAFMRMVEKGQIALDQPVCSVLPSFSGLRPILPYEDPLKWGSYVDVSGREKNSRRDIQTVDAGKITFRQLLTHTSGLPAWRAFKDQPDTDSARKLALETFFAYTPDTRVLYSDVGLILLGMAIEKIAQHYLDYIVRDLVTNPLGLNQTRFLPYGTTLPLEVAPTEYCKWRNRRVIGEVHDESASRLGGIAGHAGIFSTAQDIARFGQSFLVDVPASDEVPHLLQPGTIAEMTSLQAEYNEVRRGLGFQLWSPDPEASSNPFSQRTFGHTGFTGTSVWIDPDRRLVVALLTNEVYHGRENRGIAPLRVNIHRAIVQAVDEGK
jgi:CubicO group peptidase (beta-lactamase class C family)